MCRRGRIERRMPSIRNERKRSDADGPFTLLAPMSYTFVRHPAVLLLAAAIDRRVPLERNEQLRARAERRRRRSRRDLGDSIRGHARLDRPRRFDLPCARVPQLSRRRREGSRERSRSHRGALPSGERSYDDFVRVITNGVPDGDQGQVAQARDARAWRSAPLLTDDSQGRRCVRLVAEPQVDPTCKSKGHTDVAGVPFRVIRAQPRADPTSLRSG